MSDTALNKIIRYGTEVQRLAFTPNPATGSQVLYVWYQTNTTTFPIGMYVWLGSGWTLVNPAPPRETLKRKSWINFAGNNQFEQQVGMPSLTASGTKTDGSTSTLIYTRYTNNNLNGLMGVTGNGVLANTYFKVNNGMRTFYKVRTGPSIANIRIWLVVGLEHNMSSDNPALSYIGFRYSTPAADAGWKGFCCNGAAINQTFTSGFGAIAINTDYELEMLVESGVASFYVNGVHIGDISTNIPTVPLGLWARAINTVAEAKQFLMSFIYAESP